MDAFLRRVERIRREEQVARALSINQARPPPFQPVRAWRRRDKYKSRAEALFTKQEKKPETKALQTLPALAPCFGCGKPSRTGVCIKCKHLSTKTLLARAAARRASA